LANNEDGVCGASARHKAELHFVNVHHVANEGVYENYNRDVWSLYPSSYYGMLWCCTQTVNNTILIIYK